MSELLRDLWYFAALSSEVRTGKLVRKLLLNEPIVLGRDKAGAAFALRDICPHRAAPLSAGRMVEQGGVETVECPYHGWRFRTDGACAAIPSLAEGQALDPTRIRVQRFFMHVEPDQTGLLVHEETLHTDGACAAIPSLAEGQALDPTRIRVQRFFMHEQAGLIWLYVPSNPRAEAPAIPPPDFADLAVKGTPKLVDRMVFAAHVDHAVVGLMDPAHGPYVHAQWWWRGRHDLRAKEKKFEPRDMGFAMVRHAPSGNSYAYKVLGGAPATEITFKLPCIRWEDIRAGKTRVLALTCLTPLDNDRTEITQLFYWNHPLLSLAKPVVAAAARAFLRQDGMMVNLQKEGLARDPALLWIDDSDTQAKWYHKLKREWIASRAEGRAFVNPLEPATLRWRS